MHKYLIFKVLKLGNIDEGPGAQEVIYWIAKQDGVTTETKPQTPDLVGLSAELPSFHSLFFEHHFYFWFRWKMKRNRSDCSQAKNIAF